MSDNRDDVILSDWLESAERIQIYIRDMTFDAFLKDIRTQDAVIRNLEIIGEATKNLSAEIRDNNEDVPWKSMARLRDRLIHHYFGINFDIVWSIVSTDLPETYVAVKAIYAELTGSGSPDKA